MCSFVTIFLLQLWRVSLFRNMYGYLYTIWKWIYENTDLVYVMETVNLGSKKYNISHINFYYKVSSETFRINKTFNFRKFFTRFSKQQQQQQIMTTIISCYYLMLCMRVSIGVLQSTRVQTCGFRFTPFQMSFIVRSCFRFWTRFF